jgi:hypothetical protein
MAMPDNLSTLNKKKPPRPSEQAAAAKPAAPKEKEKGNKPRGKLKVSRRLIVIGSVLLTLIVLIALLPMILAHTPLLGAIVRRSARLDGTISFQSASLGWFSSTSLAGVTIRDPQGDPVLEAERVTCNRALLRLIFSSSNLGTLRIEKPKLTAKFSHEGSNVETVLAKWLGESSGTAGGGAPCGVDLSLEVADGEAAITDTDTQQNWHVSNLQLALDLARRLAWPARVEGSATIDDPAHPGSITVKSQIKASDAPPANPGAWLGLAGTEGDATVQAVGLPRGMFRRFAAKTRGLANEGTFDADLSAQWSAADGAKITYRGDIGQWQPLIDIATGHAGVRLAGRVAGNAAIQQSESGIVCKAESDVEQLNVDAPNGQSFRDPHVHCVVQCGYQMADGMLKIDQTAVQFSGGNFYGFQVGPGELKTHIANGTLQAEPMQVACNQGTLTVQPELRMAARPMEFRLAASNLAGGKLADHVQLDAAACHSALKYVVPIIASTTQSQGQFSVELDGCRIPLGDLMRAEIGGRVIVHSATMTPGPIVQQLTPMLTSPPALVRIPAETVIQFRMTEGRVYHQGLVLALPDGQIRTYGSVGLDNSVKIMVEFSVPLSWLPKSAVTDAIRKQKLQVPMGGTLDGPRIDVAELDRVRKQVLANLTHGVLQGGIGELGNQLNKLIKPGK